MNLKSMIFSYNKRNFNATLSLCRNKFSSKNLRHRQLDESRITFSRLTLLKQRVKRRVMDVKIPMGCICNLQHSRKPWGRDISSYFYHRELRGWGVGLGGWGCIHPMQKKGRHRGCLVQIET